MKTLPGLGLAALVAAAGTILAGIVPLVDRVTLSILVGLALANAVRLPRSLEPGLRLAEKRILEIAIVLFGLELQLGGLARLGASALLVIVGIVAGTVLAGMALGRWLRMEEPSGLLVGVGAGICGSAAIAAVAPLLRGRRDRVEEHAGLAIAAINLVGVAGLFVVPTVAAVLVLEGDSAGLLAGASLPAVGHVVAAGFMLGDEAGRAAIGVKMGRVLLLAPLLLVVAALEGRRVQRASRGPLGSLLRHSVPWFVVGFFLASVVASLGWLPSRLLEPLGLVADAALLLAMAAIGLKIRAATLFRQGPRALLLGALLVGLQVMLLVSVLRLG